MNLKYAIFDMDGLMFDTERLFIQSFLTSVSEKTGMSFPEEKLKSLLGLNRAATEKVFPTLFGTKYSCSQCYAISDIWVKEYISTHGLPIKAGLKELLSYLKEKGFRIAVASSTAREKVAGYVEKAGLTTYFDVIMGGDIVTKGKPDPQIFLMTAESLGCTAPSQCVVFEDSKNGLLAGYHAGMSVIVVPDMLDPTTEYPGYAFARVDTLDQAIPVLDASAGE